MCTWVIAPQPSTFQVVSIFDRETAHRRSYFLLRILVVETSHGFARAFELCALNRRSIRPLPPVTWSKRTRMDADKSRRFLKSCEPTAETSPTYVVNVLYKRRQTASVLPCGASQTRQFEPSPFGHASLPADIEDAPALGAVRSLPQMAFSQEVHHDRSASDCL